MITCVTALMSLHLQGINQEIGFEAFVMLDSFYTRNEGK